MKRIISVLLTLTLLGSLAFAQGRQNKKDGNDWREKMRAEQVAFITSELDLTESEAQAFWPVYNEVQKQRRDAFKAAGEAYMALEKGVDEKDVASLLEVLPVNKVAKLLLAEEKFRQKQIHRLGQGRGPGQGGRPGGPGNGGRQPSLENEPSTM